MKKPKHYLAAERDRGESEIAGRLDNPRIVEMFADVGHSWVKDDETAWCAAALGSWLERSGVPSTRKLNARSYLDHKHSIPFDDLDDAEIGDIVIFWRDKPNSWKGHVALYEGHTSNRVKVLGGNQNNAVNSTWYPSDRIIGLRKVVYPNATDRPQSEKQYIDSVLLRKLFPTARADLIAELPDALNYVFEKYEINTPRRVAMFLAQVSTETGGLEIMEESLNYSAERLMEVWPTRFRTLAQARQYARDPVKLGNYVYDRFSNKGIPGAGYKYRGRGLLQTTFIDNYRTVSRELGIDAVEHPDLLLDPWNGALAAGAYWDERGLNKFADEGDVEGARRKINGGTIGLERAKREYERLLPMVQDVVIKRGVKRDGAIVGTGIVGGILSYINNPTFAGAAIGIAIVAAAGAIVYYRRKKVRK
jgi:putative chitinase